MLQPNSSISFFASSKSKLQLAKDESKLAHNVLTILKSSVCTYHRAKEADEGPKIYELENIEKTVLDDEATIHEMKDKVERLSGDIKKATTSETRAVHYCRRGALLRKVLYTENYVAYSYYIRVIKSVRKGTTLQE